MTSHRSPPELSVPGISSAPVCFVEELQVPPQIEKPVRTFLGWGSGRGRETQLPKLLCPPPLA